MSVPDKDKDKPGSLLSKNAMGGIIGGKGYDFQTRYIVCHLPEWLLDSDFSSFLNEGTGDVDLLFVRKSGEERRHIQIKDHPVAPAEFREVVQAFARIDKEFKGIHNRFVLACPSLSEDLRSLENALARYRGAKPHYESVPHAIEPTRDHIREKLKDLKVVSEPDLILDRFWFDTGPVDFSNDGSCQDFFRGRIVKLPQFTKMVANAVEPIYPGLLQHVLAKRGNNVGATEVLALVKTLVAAGLEPNEATIAVNLQIWTNEKYPRKPDFELNWSELFSRTPRTVPTAETWNSRLLVELADLRDAILASRTERLITLQGKLALSGAIAFGATFPRVGGWTIEVQQPGSPSAWRSDVPLIPGYEPTVEERPGTGSGEAIAVVFSVTGQAQDAVETFLRASGIDVKTIAVIAPPTGPGSTSIRSVDEAVTFAQCARDKIHDLLRRNGAKITHLFFLGPQGLAVFLGQRLSSVGSVQLYEHLDPGYSASVLLRT